MINVNCFGGNHQNCNGMATEHVPCECDCHKDKETEVIVQRADNAAAFTHFAGLLREGEANEMIERRKLENPDGAVAIRAMRELIMYYQTTGKGAGNTRMMMQGVNAPAGIRMVIVRERRQNDSLRGFGGLSSNDTVLVRTLADVANGALRQFAGAIAIDNFALMLLFEQAYNFALTAAEAIKATEELKRKFEEIKITSGQIDYWTRRKL